MTQQTETRHNRESFVEYNGVLYGLRMLCEHLTEHDLENLNNLIEVEIEKLATAIEEEAKIDTAWLSSHRQQIEATRARIRRMRDEFVPSLKAWRRPADTRYFEMHPDAVSCLAYIFADMKAMELRLR